jgi:small subunit ribosomal protein S1
MPDGASGWLPCSEVSWSSDDPVLHTQLVVGQHLSLQVVGCDHKHRRLLLSLRQAKAAPVDWSVVEATFPVGAIVEKSILWRGNRGFVIGISHASLSECVSGWLPDSELSWATRDRTIQWSLVLGQTIRLRVIGYSQEDRRILLSLRQLEDPAATWSAIVASYPVGSVVEGSVVWRSTGSSIVRLSDATCGWLSDGELSWSRDDRSIRDSLAVGQSLRLRVISHSPERRTLALSLRQVEEHPFDCLDESTFVGTTHSGVVTNVLDYGAFVRLPMGADGLLHRSALPEGLSPQKGDSLDVLVESFDKVRRRVSLVYVRGLD